MNQGLIFLLEAPDQSTFTDLIRGFFAGIIKFLYKYYSNAIDLMYDLAAFDYGLDGFIDSIGSKIFNVILIFMIFKLTLSVMTYLVEPDSFTDGSKGFAGIIKRIIISIVLLISINPIFIFLADFQDDIIDSEIITSVFATTDKTNILKYGDIYAYGVKMNANCEEGKKVYTFSQGDHMALLLLKPFIQPYSREEVDNDHEWDLTLEKINEKDGYCGTELNPGDTLTYVSGTTDNKIALRSAISGPNSAEGFMYKTYYEAEIADDSLDANKYAFEFNYFFALLAGLVALLIVVSFCFDVVVRSLTLIVLKIMAPIPIISYISPKGKSSEMLGIWGKKLLSVWASLFIRIIILSLGTSFIGAACNALSQNETETSLVMEIFIILGILMFMKKLPKLLEEIIPGLKLDGGFELNPLKRIHKDALGGKYISGGIAAAGNSVLQSGIQAGSNALAFGRNKMLLKKQLKDAEKNNDKEKAAKIQRKLNRMSGSTGWLNLGSTITGGALRGAYQGAGSGFKTGTSGSANILKNVKGDTEKGNRSRNNAQNIFNFNSQLKEDYKSGDIEKEDYKAQKYGWIDRNVVERIDRNLGIKTDYGGYGYYDKKIGDLSRDIENLQSQEHSVRTALAQVSQYLPQIDALREQVDNKGKSLAEALRKVQNDFGFDDSIKAAIIQDYHNNKHHLDAITYFDQETKRMKAEKKSYEEMLEARESAKKS